jgi:aminopeptidase N
MVRCALGDKVFFGGLNRYLEANQYDSVTSDMLFDAWDKYISDDEVDVKATWTSNNGSMCGSLGKNTNQALLPAGASVADVFDTWTRQMGYPFIRVNTEGKTLKLSQARFLNNPNEDPAKPDSNLDYNWYVPLSISTGETFESFWMMNNKDEQIFELNGLSADPAYVVVNDNYRSLVRVLYEGDAKFNIQGQLASDVNSVNEKSRAQMMFDYFAFAENDVLTGVKVTDALEFTEFASRDTDKTVWDLYARGISYIRSIMKHTSDKAVLDKYLQEIIGTFYSKNNWNIDVTKINDMERTAMSLSLIEACKYGTADCLAKASEKFSAFDTTTGANELDRDQKLAGYCYGIQEGSAEQWDALWKLYEREQNANEKSTLTYGLACSKDTEILKKYMQYGIDTVRVQDKHTVFNYVSGSDYGREVSWNFIQDNWSWFYDMGMNQGWTRVPSVLNKATETFSDSAKKSEVGAFRKRIESENQLGSFGGTFDGIIVKIDKNIKWRADNQAEIVKYINNRENDGENNAQLIATSTMMLATVLALNENIPKVHLEPHPHQWGHPANEFMIK